jgi:acetyltransferase
MGIVAEVDFEGRKRLVGVGRLISDPDVVIAEYAVLVTDEWQHKELGVKLTEYCEEIARNAGVKKLYAETTKDNKAMIAVFRKQGFSVEYGDDSNVSVVKELN